MHGIPIGSLAPRPLLCPSLQEAANGGTEGVSRETQAAIDAFDKSWEEASKVLDRALSGDYQSILTDMFGSKDLDNLFSQPDVLALHLEVLPVLKAFKGTEGVFAKKPEELTPADVRASIVSTSICMVGWSMKTR
jgi:hypothetical protein